MESMRRQMSLMLFWLRESLSLIALSVFTGLVAGAATVGLLATINEVLNQPGTGMAGGSLLLFVGLCAMALTGRAVSDIFTNRVGQQVVATLRKSLAQKILSAPIDALEQYRSYRLMPVLTQDVDMVSDLAFILASTMIAFLIALGCLGYLAWLSLPLFGMVLVTLLAGVSVQILAQSRGVAGFWKAREYEEQLHKNYRAISEGAKELRMHRMRRARMVEEQIDHNIEMIRSVNTRAINTYVLAAASGSALFFLLIALTLGWASVEEVEPTVLSGFVLVLLYLKGPVEQIAQALPHLGRAKVAFQRIADLSARFHTPESFLYMDRPMHGLPLVQSIELRDVTYTFKGGSVTEAFTLGPLDLKLKKGELNFIVGDNGSGKTTMLKLLLGLYAPDEGQILLDGRPLRHDMRDNYRQLFTPVFSDYFLFDDIAVRGHSTRIDSLTDAAQRYLQRLELAHKVRVEEGVFNTLDLSSGQRKRLALVHAYLEARPVMVFDEWAADQDPAFRHLFYTELLPELRDRGHMLVVISHDDRYFHLADRIIRMSEGRIVEDTAQQSPQPA